MAQSYLLDTHCLLWFQGNSQNLPSNVLNVIRNPKNTVYFSQISLYEIAIKQKVGKLPQFKASAEDVYQLAETDGFEFLNIRNQHIYAYQTLPFFDQHRDPFDRLLIATAITHNSIILSIDGCFKLYSGLIDVFWE